MRIRVLFFGMLREQAAAGERQLELPEASPAQTVLDHFGSLHPGQIWNSVAIAVNGQYAAGTTALCDGDEVALLPPVSGGSGALVAEHGASLTREPMDREAAVQRCRAAEDGAIVVFDGVVRNNTRGRRTLFLVYEGYEEMALRQMEALAKEAGQRFAVRAVRIEHRLGRLEIGESSVLIVVASAHRGAAFDACRWVIDTLKTTVPIWKKEYFEDGAVWADGEPFPEALRPAGLPG